MLEKPLRIVLVGAGTLLGKALNDELAASAFSSADFLLIDDDEALGKLTAVADEVTFIQRIEPESFDGCDFAFFAGSPELTRKHWPQALQAGARIVDVSGGLEGTPGIPVRAPWVQEESAGGGPVATKVSGNVPDLQTRAVVAAHPVALLLALLAARSQRVAALHGVWATLLQPASEYGHAALEELHRQTANLLSFQPVPTEIFGGQSAFTLAVSFGTEGRVALPAVAATIRRHYTMIAAIPAAPCALQVVQAPVFHGYGLSIAVEFAQAVAANALASALAGPHVRVISDAEKFPVDVPSAEDDVPILVQPVLEEVAPPGGPEAVGQKSGHAKSGKAGLGERKTNRFWLWMAADNLKLAAQNALACATELNRLRPRGSVQ